MKKYISILIFGTIGILQSCDRSDPNYGIDYQIPSQKHVDNILVARSAETSIKESISSYDRKKKRKDKSHWRVHIDTVR